MSNGHRLRNPVTRGEASVTLHHATSTLASVWQKALVAPLCFMLYCPTLNQYNNTLGATEQGDRMRYV